MGIRKQKKTVEKFKSRKEVRKGKRLQKKANRVHFQKRKKELKLERKERLQQKNKSKNKNDKTKSIENNVPANEIDDDDDDDDDVIDAAGDYDDDEEIESDFELSDEELEKKTKTITKEQKSSKPKKSLTQLEMDHQRFKARENSLRKDMNKQRVKQLKLSNEDEDKTIRKLEKLLKLDKSKSKKGVPKMFHDGLDYALEVCLPENMEKMYAAAKGTANADLLSDDEWQEDFALATGEKGQDSTDEIETKPKTAKQTENKQKGKKVKKVVVKPKRKSSKKLEIIDSDLSDVDSEFEGVDSGSDDEDIDSSENLAESDSDNEAPEELQTVSRSSKKRQLEKDKAKHKAVPMESEDDEQESVGDSESEDFDDDDSEMSDSEDQPPQKVAKKSSAIHSDGESDSKLASEFDVSDSDAQEEQEKPDVWEDIYGRKRDKQGNIIKEEINDIAGLAKYIPPHLRARLQAETNGTLNGQDPKQKEKLMRLKKLLKGLMNRLSEANMHKISTEIDNLYMRNSRNDMNVTLASLMSDALISQALAPERLVMEHALLIATLHANVGTEVGANLLESLVDRFHQMLENGVQQYEVEDKTLDNVILVLCHMYTFRIFHHRLIYELLNRLVRDFCEKSVECILLTLRSVGFSLRKDDPAALKELIIIIQKKTSEAPDELKSNARLKYMLDVLTAIKNNNVNRIPNYDPTLAEHMRKILKTLCTNGKYVTTLNISLDDLVNVQQRGKWWVVGSAWTGNINDIAAATKSTTIKKSEQKFSEQLLALARKQRMNTDERRNVFCVLMSAEDYIDAFEKLLHLAIKDHRVIISVIVHCCLSEKAFNPYYAVVAQKFCDYDRKYLLATQFSLWDRIKDLQSHTKEQLTNLAQLILYLVTNSALPISVLKVIEFGELEKMTLRLVRQILLGILLGKEDTCKEIFQRIAPSAKLKSFKDGIRLFMHHFLLKGGVKNGVAADKLDLLKKRISIADKSLDTSTIRF